MPPELVLITMVLAAVSVMLTLPLEAAVKLVAFKLFAPENAIPPVPAAKFTDGALRAPAAFIPLLADEALRLKEEAELEFRTIPPL